MYGTCGRIDNKADFDFDYCYVGPYKVYWDLTAFTNHKEIKPQTDQQTDRTQTSSRGGLSTVLFWVLLGGSEGVFTPVDRLICSEIGIKIITMLLFIVGAVRIQIKSSQVTFIYIALLTIQIVSKHLTVSSWRIECQ